MRFLPVQLAPEANAVELPRATKPTLPPDATIEIALPDGTKVRVGRDVSAAALRRVLGALRG